MITLFLDGLFLKSDLPRDFNGQTSLDLILSKSLINDFDRIVLLQNGLISNVPDEVKNVVIDNNNLTPALILSSIEKEMKNSTACVVFNVGNPFYDATFMKKMLEKHIDYIADYTYGIGYPKNLLPQIINNKIIPQLIELVKNDEDITNDYIFYSISKDINSYDIETFLSEIDLRMFRIAIGSSDKGERLFTKRVYEQIGDNYTIDTLVHFIYYHLDFLYTIPYMVTLEISNYSKIDSLYLPKSNDKIFLDFEKIKKFSNELFEINDAIHIVLGGLGEPFEHPDIIEIIKFLSTKYDLIIETLAYFDEQTLEYLNQIENKEQITFVIDVDSFSKELYNIIHPNGDFNLVESNIDGLEKEGFVVYRRITRMIDNEEEIERAIREKKNKNLIINKYSTFCGRLPDKKVVDLSPLDRIPCFHLRRELFVDSAGNLPLCKYCNSEIVSNINEDSIEVIIEKFKRLFLEHTRNRLKECCKKCDDYYTFNF